MSRKEKINLKNEGKNHFETSKEKGLYSVTKQAMNFKKQVLSVMVVSREKRRWEYMFNGTKNVGRLYN